jgi:hypothetical protein
VGGQALIQVQPANLGTASETFSVAVTFSAPGGATTTIATQQTTLAPGASTTLTVPWQVGASAPVGAYTLRATAALAGDVNATNNSGTASTTVVARRR